MKKATPVIIIVLIIVIAFIMIKKQNVSQPTEKNNATEYFIEEWLENKNGTLATYIKRSNNQDSDEVQGREALSETLGLWMRYGLKNNDEMLFEKAYDQLDDFFLESNGFVHWKLEENGESRVQTNALIDDFRIIDGLLVANDMWDKPKYKDTATLISNYILEHNVNNGYFTDFYEYKKDNTSNNITLSYITTSRMKHATEEGLLDEEITKNTIHILTDAPVSNSFFPKSYNVENNQYHFDQDINLIDQAIVAYNLAQVNGETNDFLKFVKEQMDNNSVIYGKYDKDTKEPTVDYESPAIYGYLILFSLEVGEDELANDIYDRMSEFKVTDKNSKYYGGYSVYDDDTHIFDNLIPLLAEQEMDKKSVK